MRYSQETNLFELPRVTKSHLCPPLLQEPDRPPNTLYATTTALPSAATISPGGAGGGWGDGADLEVPSQSQITMAPGPAQVASRSKQETDQGIGEGPGKAQICWKGQAEGKEKGENGAGEEAWGQAEHRRGRRRTKACERQQAPLQGQRPQASRCPDHRMGQAGAGWQQGSGSTALVTWSWIRRPRGLQEVEGRRRLEGSHRRS